MADNLQAVQIAHGAHDFLAKEFDTNGMSLPPQARDRLLSTVFETVRDGIIAANVPFRLLDLYPELRNRVYEIVLVQDETIKISLHEPHIAAPPALLQLNHQIRAEAASIYYSRNTFVCDPSCPSKYYIYPHNLWNWLKSICAQQAKFIRRLVLTFFHDTRHSLLQMVMADWEDEEMVKELGTPPLRKDRIVKLLGFDCYGVGTDAYTVKHRHDQKDELVDLVDDQDDPRFDIK